MSEMPLTAHISPTREPLDLRAYEKVGGYQALRKALGQMTPSEITEEVKRARLRGRGGAGFLTGLKWSFVPMGEQARRPKYLVVNGDEMEPGAFKDRLLLEGAPHLLLEGVILASYAVQAEAAYVFLRWAYRQAEQRLRHAIAEAEASGYLGPNILNRGWGLQVHVHVSAGRYMAGV